MPKHSTNSNRNKRSKLKKQYSKLREDAQLHGIIPTTPEGAVHPEKVASETQGEQDTTNIDRKAVKQGWAVPEEKKALVVMRLLEPFEKSGKTVTKEGVEIDTTDHNLLAKNARTLLIADQRQYERDHPNEAGIAKGASNTSNTNAVQINTAINWSGVLSEIKSADDVKVIDEKLNAPLRDIRTPEERKADRAREVLRELEEMRRAREANGQETQETPVTPEEEEDE